MKWILSLFALLSPSLAAAGAIYVLAINGGGSAQENYASHLAHLHQWVALLSQKGIPQDQIFILASDGADPTPDLLIREPDPDGVWLLDGTPLGDHWRNLEKFENSVVPGFHPRPATFTSLVRTLADLRRRMEPGDTLLLYVTDHGLLNPRDPLDNKIVLWGNRAGITVRQLGALLANLPQGIQVVSLMSQCFSGGFAYLGEARARGRFPISNTCGFFSSTPDQPAYGCYPEIRGQKAVGHSFEFFSALAKENRFIAAHHKILQSDDSPDIPLRSSDVYWAEILIKAARSKNQQVAMADQFLAQAVSSGRIFHEWQLADRIANRFSLEKPNGISEIDHQIEMLERQLNLIQADVKTWSNALADFNESNQTMFFAEHPEWNSRLKNRLLVRLSPNERRQRLTDFILAFNPFFLKDKPRMKIADRLVQALNGLEAIAYRIEVRIAVLTRIRLLYLRMAGRFYGESHPDSKMVHTALTLEKCEEFQLPGPPAPVRGPQTLPLKPFPKLKSDEHERASLRPAWLGMVYRAVDTFRHNSLGLSAGAVFITKILPGSPAAQVGLQRGDVVTHINGRVLERPGDLRSLIATSTPQKSIEVGLRRRGLFKIVYPVLKTPPIP